MGLLFTLAFTLSAALRPPSVPLVTHDPYFSIWSPADKLTDAETVHWTGKQHRLTSLVRIDQHGFRLMGKAPPSVPALPQTSLEVLPTRTIYAFEGDGLRLTLTFLSPALPEDLMISSRPVTYLTWTAVSIDGKEHHVEVYFEASFEIAVNDRKQELASVSRTVPGLTSLGAGTTEQPILRAKGDDLRIDWGHFFVSVPDFTNQVNLSDVVPLAERVYYRSQKAWLMGADRGAFLLGWADGGGPGSSEVHQGNFRLGEQHELMEHIPGNHWCFGSVGSQPISRWLMVAYDDEFSINYFGQNLRPYWRRNGDDAEALLKKAAADYPALKERCEKFDAQLMADLRRAGGRKYAELCALAYRQTFAGNKLCADGAGQPLLFPKENFSNGCIGTVDVLFPQAPFFLVLSPALTKAMLVPILDYASSSRWPYAYAPHDLGTYPHATGQVYGMGGKDGDRMPVEESGNMLIMLAALARHEGNADFARTYWPMLTKWADYLVTEGLDPKNQLCSADMFGHLPRNANLALKAIIGIGGYSQLCNLAGKPDEASKYLAIARDYAGKWQDLARGEGRTILAYGQTNTWAMKHNLIWDRVLGLNLFPPAIADAEIAWYREVQKTYGLPVDNRTDTSLIDWALWSIAPARTDEAFQALLEPIWRYANETPSRVPLSDWFVTTDARQKGFQARPVVGGIFIRLLADPALWKSWASRGANPTGPWAPFPTESR